MGLLNQVVPVDGVVFDHGLSKRQVASLSMANVSENPVDSTVLRGCGIDVYALGPDEVLKATLVACMLHPLWEQSHRSLAAKLVDLAVTRSPEDDFDQPAKLKADITPALLELAGRSVRLAEDLHGRRCAINAAHILTRVAQFNMDDWVQVDPSAVPQPLLQRVGRLFPSRASLVCLASSARDLVGPHSQQGNPTGSGFFADPWDQVEYRQFDGERWSTRSLIYGVEVADRVGEDVAGLSLTIDPWILAFYRGNFAGRPYPPPEIYEGELRLHIRSMSTTERHAFLLALAEFAAKAKHAVTPEDEGPFSLPAIPVPASTKVDLGYRLNEVMRRWILGGSPDEAAKVASIIVERGEELALLAAERALVSVGVADGQDGDLFRTDPWWNGHGT